VILPQGRDRIIGATNNTVDLIHPYSASTEVNHIFISEQVEKCTRKLESGDYDGTITNARSLVEAVLIAIETEMDAGRPEYNGNLIQLYKRMQGHLNLTPGQVDLADSVRQVLFGLTSIVNGLASLRNTISDSHAMAYRPVHHHAPLAVNCSRTVSQFLFDTKEYQMRRGDTRNS
jgi:hypothetical protein